MTTHPNGLRVLRAFKYLTQKIQIWLGVDQCPTSPTPGVGPLRCLLEAVSLRSPGTQGVNCLLVPLAGLLPFLSHVPTPISASWGDLFTNQILVLGSVY